MIKRFPHVRSAIGIFLALASLMEFAWAETRVFTDVTGRVVRGELVGVSGDSVTIKLGDGQTFTLKASTFCPSDIKYFEEHGLQPGTGKAETANPPSPISVPNPAAVSNPTTAPTPTPTAAPGSHAGDLLIEAYIDGPSELRVKANGIYWINGKNAKPGRIGNHNDPTFVNGAAWYPVWKNGSVRRGEDQSREHAFFVGDPAKLEFKLLAVSENRKGEGIEKRDPIRVSMSGQELSVEIPDKQAGARWYKFSLTQGGAPSK